MEKNSFKILQTFVFVACFCFTGSLLYAQKQVYGKVVDEQNAVIVGASVSLKGTTTGTSTDIEGNYKVTVPSDSSILVFMYLGYQTQEVLVSKRTEINIQMKEESQALGEVVVTGFSTQVRKDMTYAVSTVSSKKRESKQKRESKRVINSASPVAASPVASTAYAASLPISRDIQDNEEYGHFTENNFLMVGDQPLSTFSIDVDAASYSNMRRYVNSGNVPPQDAIRTEELINYFDYNYPQPRGEHPINGIVELASCPWNPTHRLARIGVKAKDIEKDKLPASNLVFLIDVSGSMDSPNRLPLVKTSLKMLVNELRDKDQVAIVVYSGAAGEVLPPTKGSEKKKIIDALEKLSAGGSTAGGEGIQLAYKIARNNFIKDGTNRVILATDGDFNVGVSSNNGLEQLIEKERKSGVFLSILGYGMGNYKDSKMQVLAQKGNGNHAYIDNITEAQKVLVKEFGGTLFTIAKDVKIQVEFNPGKVHAYRLIGYESRMLNKEDFNDDTKDAGEMGAGHTVTALYEIIPPGVKSNLIPSVDQLKYQTAENQARSNKSSGKSASDETLTLKIRYKQPDGNTSKKLEVPALDSNNDFEKASENFRFSAAVAQVGMLLHDSPYKGTASYKDVIKQAEGAYGNDSEGYRHEFVKLVKSLELIGD